MATIMEKDVLIEAIAEAKAVSINKHLSEFEESKRLGELRSYVYKSLPENLDFDSMVNEILSLKGALESLPDLSGGIYDK